MTWRKIDDRFDHHRKVRALAELGRRRCSDALALWVLGQCEAARDPESVVERSYVSRAPTSSPKRAAIDLTSVGLWIEVERGWAFHDDGDWNETPAEKRRKRSANAERQRRHRQRQAPADNALRARDSRACVNPTRTGPDPPLKTPPTVQAPLELVPTEPTRDPVAEVWRLFLELHGSARGPTAVLDGKRKARIKARLGEGSQAEIEAALRGALADPWIMGVARESRRGFRTVEAILRDRAQVEKFAALDGEPTATAGGAIEPAPHGSFEHDDPDAVWGQPKG